MEIVLRATISPQTANDPFLVKILKYLQKLKNKGCSRSVVTSVATSRSRWSASSVFRYFCSLLVNF